MSKYFIFGKPDKLSKKALTKIRQEQEGVIKTADEIVDEMAEKKLSEEDNLTHVEGRVVVKLDIKNKDSHTFESGLTIRRERNFNNFNRRETQPVNVIVISGEGIPKGAEMLVDHNALHETNRINDYKNNFENEDSDRVRYFSIETYECYAWRMGSSEWKAIPPFEFGLRVFKPYKGFLVGIEPELLKDTLYCTSGELHGQVVKTVKASDYCLVYQELNGREANLICFRPFGDEKRKMPEEAIAILHDLTEQVNNGELLIGYETKDAHPLQINAYAD